MKFIADFHIHSHFSIATSKRLIPEYLEYWAKIKGIDLIGTGDCIHPGWIKELKEKLIPLGNGLFVLKDEYILEESKLLKGENYPERIYFLLTGEVSNIYKKNDRVRKVHNLTIFPDYESLGKVATKLDSMGNIRSDGRPILGLDSKILLEMVLESSDNSFFIPAHIWTPWFSVLGSKSGFDHIEECYEDLTDNIFAVETGLSSDPAMNWACSFLDKFNLVSNSDAHSPDKLGREANLFDTNLDYFSVYNSLKSGKGFLGTIEFHPQEGKYHYDGHRKCNVCWDPLETIKNNGICTECGKPVTKGVMYRVAELADRADTESAANKRDFYSITQLPDIIAEIFGVKNSRSVKVQTEYMRLIHRLGSEFNILLNVDISEIKKIGGEILAEGIKRLRADEVIIDQGYDGEFGKIKVFKKGEIEEFSGKGLFNLDIDIKKINPNKEKKITSIKFDIAEFNRYKKDHIDMPELEKKSSILNKRLSSSSKKNRFKLTDNQKEAVEYLNGPCMVIAGPGSGKTRVLTERIQHLIKKYKVSPENILSLTFSNKAASEIRERVKVNSSIKGIDILTFHSLGLKILNENLKYISRKENFTIIDDDEKIKILEEFIEKKGNVKKTIKIISEIKQGVRSNKEGEADTNFFNRYNLELEKRNLLDIDDLIYLTVKLLKEESSLADKYQNLYKFILIDEYQDINSSQYELIRLLAPKKESNIFVIGDPNQAIYGFRGSDVKYIESFIRDYPGLRKINLSRSFRCPEIFLKAGNRILNREDDFSGNDIFSLVEIYKSKTGRGEADWIASSIEGMMGGVRSFSINSGMSDGNSIKENISFSDFAVLCRSSFMFDNFYEAFANHGIPLQVIGTDPFFKDKAHADIIQLFKEIFYNTEKLDQGEFSFVQDMVNRDALVSDVLKELFKKNNLKIKKNESLVRYSGKFKKDYNGFFRSFAIGRGIDFHDRKYDAVSLMTIHASKGLEFDYVFIPGCEEKIIPFELFGRIGDDELLEEERLLYVGMTRAKEKLYLTHANSRSYNGRILEQRESRFLKRIEDELVNLNQRENKLIRKDNQLNLFE